MTTIEDLSALEMPAIVAALELALQSGFKATVAHLDRSGVPLEKIANGVRAALLTHLVRTLGHVYDGFPDGLLEVAKADLAKLAAAYNARPPAPATTAAGDAFGEPIERGAP